MRTFVLTATIVIATMSMASCSKKSGVEHDAAYKKCTDDGYVISVRQDAKGDPYNVCVDNDGNECDAWSYYRNECALDIDVGEPEQAGE